MIKGFTCSAFDLLHPGHLIMLEECKRNCDYLIVGLQTDPTIDRPEKTKPIQTVTERMIQLKACKYVDEIVVYDTEKDLENLLASLDIQRRFIGEEYFLKPFTGEKICEDRGIDIYYNDKRRYNYSSTELRNRFKDRFDNYYYRNPYFTYFYHLGNFASKAKDGLFLEFGVYKGHSIRSIAKNTKNKVYGFDSFKGLPEAWQGEFGEGSLACDIPTNLPDNVELVIGYFEETLEKFLEEHKEPITFIHVDCDIYSATKYLLEKCHDRMADQCIICFDDYQNYQGFEEHEYKAFNEYVAKYDVKCVNLYPYGLHQMAFRIIKNEEGRVFEYLSLTQDGRQQYDLQ